MSTAKSIDSYSDTLIAVLTAFQPRKVYEWGPGKSTDIMVSFPSVDHIDTVEDSGNWYEAYLARRPFNVTIYHRKDDEAYQAVAGVFNEYDLFFVDGKGRDHCLDNAQACLSKNGVVVLHDAERVQYQNAIRRYKYHRFTDDGNTCIMTNSEEANAIISSLAI